MLLCCPFVLFLVSVLFPFVRSVCFFFHVFLSRSVSSFICVFCPCSLACSYVWYVQKRYFSRYSNWFHMRTGLNMIEVSYNMIKPLAEEIPHSSKLVVTVLVEVDPLQRRPQQSTPQRGLPSWLATFECDDHSCAPWLGDYRRHAHLKKGPCLVCLHRLGQRCWIPASSLNKFRKAMSFNEQLDL